MPVLLCITKLYAAEPSADPFLGRWLLDPKASRYADHRCPRRMVIDMAPEGDGIRYHSETVPAVGEVFHVDYSAHYDGKPAIVTGDRGILLPVSLQRDGPRHVRATYTSAMQVVATSDRTLSPDGKIMKVVTVSHDAFGQSQTTVGIYRRDGTNAACSAHSSC